MSSTGAMSALSWSNVIKIGLPILIGFFIPILPMILTIGIFTITDTISGIKAAKTRGERIHSRAMGRTVSKFTWYSVAIILAELMRVTFIPAVPTSTIIATYIAGIELLSNLENMSIITGKDLVVALTDTLRNKIDIFKPREIEREYKEKKGNTEE